jgi:hypothetical protein
MSGDWLDREKALREVIPADVLRNLPRRREHHQRPDLHCPLCQPAPPARPLPKGHK